MLQVSFVLVFVVLAVASVSSHKDYIKVCMEFFSFSFSFLNCLSWCYIFTWLFRRFPDEQGFWEKVGSWKCDRDAEHFVPRWYFVWVWPHLLSTSIWPVWLLSYSKWSLLYRI